jgi:hypothetical protein
MNENEIRKCPRCGAMKSDRIMKLDRYYLESGKLEPESLICVACSEEVLARVFRIYRKQLRKQSRLESFSAP